MANKPNIVDELKKFLKSDAAFGPDHFGAIGAENVEIFEQLFDSENKIYSRLSSNSPIVVGRRGSGKSTFLQSRRLSEKKNPQIVVEINSGSLFSAICKRISQNQEDEYVEVLADTWSAVFDLCLLVAIGGETNAPLPLVTLHKVFCTRHKDAYKKRGTATTGRLVHYFEDFSTDMLAKIKSDTRAWTNLSLHELLGLGIEFLQSEKKRAVCLIDSLEEYKISKSQQSDALAGLFKCTGEYHANRGGLMYINISIPAELYSFFTSEVSRGVMKDFSDSTWLYWHAAELLSVCSKRLFVFIKLYNYRGTEGFDLHRLRNKKECVKFLSEFFPSTIKSSSGAIEAPIAYLLRHTQLIPRHIIAILNQVFKEQTQIARIGTSVIFSEAALRKGVENKIGEITEDIIIGYREKYPNLQQVLEALIPNLPLYFDDRLIDKQFPKYVKVLHTRYQKISDYAPDATSLLRTLLDVGVVGRVKDDTSSVYVNAEFSYTIPSRDVGYSSDKDKFCFHPAFAKRFRCIYDPTVHKPVYPIGSNPEESDF